MVADTSAPTSVAQSDKYPAKAIYVIGMEGAERYSFYGMKAILTLYMVHELSLTKGEAVSRAAFFNSLVYFAPLLGGMLADWFIGRYKTILFVSFGYVAGHAVLSLVPGVTGLYVGCALIALGAGGIKPNVSAFMADQFEKNQEHLIEGAYGWFYLSINIGSTFGILMVPMLRNEYGYAVAFAAPGVAMAIALVIFVIGRKLYRKLPPAKPWAQPVATSLAPTAATGSDTKDGFRAVGRIAFVFLFISMFWALFFQYDGAWTLQAEGMNRQLFGWEMSPEHLSLLNSFFVIGLIPIMNRIYANLHAKGVDVSPLRKMKLGMFISVLAFVCALLLQVFIDKGDHPHSLWQIGQYFFLSLAEVLISVTGLEFAYTQAPPSMKSAVMAVWFLCISIGGTLTGVMASAFSSIFGEPFDWKLFYGIFTGMMLLAAIAFVFVARWYKPLFGPGSPREAPKPA
jgi:POT family proton-dependent oligopeptide transporter